MTTQYGQRACKIMIIQRAWINNSARISKKVEGDRIGIEKGSFSMFIPLWIFFQMLIPLLRGG